MKCPACFNPLKSVLVGSVTVDVCEDGCGGIWFDAFELQKIDAAGAGMEDFLVNIRRDPAVHPDLQRKRECPRCDGIKLKRRFFSPRRLVEIDECPGCAGYWLDAGELEKVRDEMEETRVTRQLEATTPELTSRMIRYLYQKRLEEAGDDF
jgi:uncharacterized protein